VGGDTDGPATAAGRDDGDASGGDGDVSDHDGDENLSEDGSEQSAGEERTRADELEPDDRRRQLIVRALGIVVTALVAGVLFATNLPPAYALVGGLAVGLPLGNVRGPRGSQFDTASYLADRGVAGRAVDVVGSIVAGSALGGGSLALLGSPGGILGFGVAAVATAVGVYAVFLLRNAGYYAVPASAVE